MLTLLLTISPLLASGILQSPASVSAHEIPDGLSAEDWRSIRQAHEASLHAVRPAAGGYQAINPGQSWRTDFDGRGFSIEPHGGGWTWGLDLLSYGFAGEERGVRLPVNVRTEGERVSYEWGAGLEEWFVNDGRGLEHGYTLRERPHPPAEAEGSGRCFTLRVRGGLHPRISRSGRGARFTNGDGLAVVTYRGLRVFDATGRDLDARFIRAAAGLRLTIDDRDARYPLTVDPIAQQAYLKASNPEPGDSFAQSAAISGNTLVVGADEEDSASGGVNGDQSDNSAHNAGAAYVFVKEGTVWSQQAYLKASYPDAGDEFGERVAISGNTVVVGARNESSGATGVNGNANDNSASEAGAAYVFVRTGTTWSQQAYLKASNTEAVDHFAYSVGISGDTIVVGATLEDSGATGINGDQSDNSTSGAGAAYVFVRNGTAWTQQAYLKASNTDPNDIFGNFVDVEGDTIAVSAYYEGGLSAGVGGDESDNSGYAVGAVYAFSRSGTIWSQQAYIKASNPDDGDGFGGSLELDGETLVVGAAGESSNATGVNGNQSDNSTRDAGAAYVFERSGADWTQTAYVKASNPGVWDSFGYDVDVLGNTIVVGAPEEASSATGVNGDQSDNSEQRAGAAYVFVRAGTTWAQTGYLKASNTEADECFGWTVAISEGAVVVGADCENSGSPGINGDQGDNSAPAAGAVYAFDLDAPWIADCVGYCGSGANTATDGYVISAPAVLGGTFQATVTGCAAGNVGAFLAAFATPMTFTSPWGEVLVNLADASGELLGLPAAVGAPAVFTLPVPIDPAFAGLVFHTQAASFGGSICLHCAHECTIGG